MANTARGDQADSTQPPVGRQERAQYEAVPASAPALTPVEDRQWAFMAHCGGILGFIPSLIIYLVFRERGPFTAQESKEALNFTVPPTIVAAVANIMAVLLAGVAPLAGTVFAFLAVAIWIFLTVYSVIAAVQVNRGQPYRYLWSLRLIH
ncbi:DUF4870 domain-containing protein [Paenarthrobacter sp. PH39-S1]|uniref:DUF4870 domain-containing protein n=1 Tax=Paenarthrobacter sp. PH39-S1 TaxID=3046204 RepID=UPI0024B9BF2F|nr:DUF4870 domain-containing protein [Paenarthrobacter sp. PH39-S1]MDJ0358392.1 DUF4870 domain-containing protein [Paenarthrobacter sp. PH39-S1]